MPTDKRLAIQIARDHRLQGECAVAVVDELRALAEVEWRLRISHGVLQAVGEIRVGREHLRILDPPVDREGEGEMVVAHHVR